MQKIEILVDSWRTRVLFDGVPINVGRTGSLLLSMLVLRSDKLVRMDEIMDFVYGDYEDPPYTNAVWMHLMKIRKQMSALSVPNKIVTHFNRGLQFKSCGAKIILKIVKYSSYLESRP